MVNGVLTLQNRLMVGKGDLAAKVIDGEAIIINLANGLYYSMDGAGAMVWDMIERRGTLAEIAEAISRVYDVSTESSQADVRALAAKLIEEQLVLLDEGGQAGPALEITAPADKLPYQPPKLVRYSDMAHFFALDPPLPELDDAAEGTGD